MNDEERISFNWILTIESELNFITRRHPAQIGPTYVAHPCKLHDVVKSAGMIRKVRYKGEAIAWQRCASVAKQRQI